MVRLQELILGREEPLEKGHRLPTQYSGLVLEIEDNPTLGVS